MVANEVKPTEVNISHKKVYGKTTEKAQLKISKARTHGSHVSGSAVSESPQPSPGLCYTALIWEKHTGLFS